MSGGGGSVHNTDTGGILAVHKCACVHMYVWACTHVSACVCMCVHVCAGASEGFILEAFSFKFQLTICKGSGGKDGIVSSCTAP